MKKFENDVCVALSCMIKHEMITAYDQDWETLCTIKPPWTLSDTFSLIHK